MPYTVRIFFFSFVFVFSAATLLLTAVSISPAFAQEEVEFTDESGQPYEPPMQINIDEASFNETNREITLDLTLNNNTDTYIDNLEFYAELHRGEGLADEGVLFEPLEYVTVVSGEIEGVFAPQEVAEKSVSFPILEGLKEDTYFIRLLVNDKSFSFQVVDYTQSPLILTGTGSFLPFITAYFRAPDIDGSMRDDFLNAGWGTHPGVDGAIVIPLDENPELAQRISEGETFYAETEIYFINDPDVPVKTLPRTALTIEENTQTTEEISIGENIILHNLPYGDGVERGGPYSVYVDITNDADEKVQEISARWLVDDITARIEGIDTETYSYRRGESLDVQVNLIMFYYHGRKEIATLSLTVNPKQGEPQTFEEEVSLDAEKAKASINFSAHEVGKNIKGISSLSVELIDSNGFVLDTYSMELKEPIAPDDRAGGKNVLYTILGTLGILAVLIGAIAILRKHGGNNGEKGGGGGSTGSFPQEGNVLDGEAKKGADKVARGKYNQSALSALSVAAFAVIFFSIGFGAFPQDASACHSPGSPSSASVNTWINGPSETICGATETFDSYVHLKCDTCINGVVVRHEFEGTTSNYTGPRDINSKTFGPIRKNRTIDSTRTFRSHAEITEDGCWCTGVVGESDSASKTVTCSVPEVSLSASPSPVDYDTASTLSWSSSNADQCEASGGWGGFKSLSGTAGTGNLTSDTSYTLTCFDDFGNNDTDSVTVGVNPPPDVSVSLSASPNPITYNTSSTLTWNVSNADQCTASGGWSGGKSASGGNESTGNLTSDTSYTLQCTNDHGSDNDSVTVRVNDPTQCQDGIDNDGDGWVDRNDPSCSSGGGNGPYDPSIDDESKTTSQHDTQCSDGIDNDGDGFIDGNDPDCLNAQDDNEAPEPDFSLANTGDIDAVLVNQQPRESTETTITAQANESFIGPIFLSVQSINPQMSGATFNFDDDTLDSDEYSEGTPFSVTVPGTATGGTYIITIQGNGDDLVRSTIVSLTVTVITPDFEEF